MKSEGKDRKQVKSNVNCGLLFNMFPLESTITCLFIKQKDDALAALKSSFGLSFESKIEKDLLFVYRVFDISPSAIHLTPEEILAPLSWRMRAALYGERQSVEWLILLHHWPGAGNALGTDF